MNRRSSQNELLHWRQLIFVKLTKAKPNLETGLLFTSYITKSILYYSPEVPCASGVLLVLLCGSLFPPDWLEVRLETLTALHLLE
ncbi:MAG: hypothetical protein U0Y10_24765 [Spirosomataceae bacterium]